MNIKDFEPMVKLNLSEDERVIIKGRAEKLFLSFEALDAAVTDAEPMVTVLGLRNVMRNDITEQTVSREELLENAPESYDGYFRVPRAVER